MYFLYTLLSFCINIYIFVIIAQVAISWLIAFDIVNQSNEAAVNLTALLHKLTDPVYSRIKKFIPPIGGMDFTPLIVIIALQILPSLLFSLLISPMYLR